MLSRGVVNAPSGHPAEGVWHQLFWPGPAGAGSVGLRVPRPCVTIRRDRKPDLPSVSLLDLASGRVRIEVRNGEKLSVTTLFRARSGGARARFGVVCPRRGPSAGHAAGQEGTAEG